ncbi:hypothetical protein [Longispora albida]|uniref:hypothetical protein n=1 Tax=Longispora albida TaxID=203523 RepID=UPI00036669E5|nr:hypothetical protein [Longispora albida]
MRTKLVMAALTAACVGSMATTTASAGPGPGGQPLTASVQGQARLAYEVAEDDVRFTVDARATYAPGSPIPATVTGTARIYHRHGDLTVWADIAVDCVTAGGPTATVTGIVVDAAPAVQDWKERQIRLGFSVYDAGKDKAGRDRAGFSGPTAPGEPLLQKCMAPAAHFGVREGGYTVR